MLLFLSSCLLVAFSLLFAPGAFAENGIYIDDSGTVKVVDPGKWNIQSNVNSGQAEIMYTLNDAGQSSDHGMDHRMKVHLKKDADGKPHELLVYSRDEASKSPDAYFPFALWNMDSLKERLSRRAYKDGRLIAVTECSKYRGETNSGKCITATVGLCRSLFSQVSKTAKEAGKTYHSMDDLRKDVNYCSGMMKVAFDNPTLKGASEEERILFRGARNKFRFSDVALKSYANLQSLSKERSPKGDGHYDAALIADTLKLCSSPKFIESLRAADAGLPPRSGSASSSGKTATGATSAH
jgi:hypothetical protein